MLKNKLEHALPGAVIEFNEPMHNPAHEGKHLAAVVTYRGFKGKSLVEQHKMVYSVLKEELKGELHALALKTREQ